MANASIGAVNALIGPTPKRSRAVLAGGGSSIPWPSPRWWDDGSSMVHLQPARASPIALAKPAMPPPKMTAWGEVVLVGRWRSKLERSDPSPKLMIKLAWPQWLVDVAAGHGWTWNNAMAFCPIA